jgi:hypothetical protein
MDEHEINHENEIDLDQELVMSPLADPVIEAIFANVEVAGLAAGSLIRVVLEADGKDMISGLLLSSPYPPLK